MFTLSISTSLFFCFLSNPTLFSFKINHFTKSSTDTERDDNILWNMEIAYPTILSVTLHFINKPLHLFLPWLQPLASILQWMQSRSLLSTVFFSTSSSSVPRKRGDRPSKKSKFHGIRYLDREGLFCFERNCPRHNLSNIHGICQILPPMANNGPHW